MLLRVAPHTESAKKVAPADWSYRSKLDFDHRAGVSTDGAPPPRRCL